MVEKRTITLVMLAMFVWASITTGFMAYYYLEQARYLDELNEKKQLLNKLTENYDVFVTKRNFLGEEYGKLYGDYQYYKFKGWFEGENRTFFMNMYSKMLDDLKDNYSDLLNSYRDLNETYATLLNRTQILLGKPLTVTKEEFDQLVDEWYTLFVSLVTKELDSSIGKTIVLTVNLYIDYNNGTSHWYNDTSIPSGSTVFDLTQKVAIVNFTYYPDMAPGHILINAINEHAQGWWLWYYWDEQKDDWVFGPVGCDAWILKDNGIYKWVCSS